MTADHDVFALRKEFNEWCEKMTGTLFSPGARSSDFYYEIWLAGRAAERDRLDEGERQRMLAEADKIIKEL
jgi:hypothetical protein